MLGEACTVVFLPVDRDDNLRLVDILAVGATIADTVEDVIPLVLRVGVPAHGPAEVASVVNLRGDTVLLAFPLRAVEVAVTLKVWASLRHRDYLPASGTFESPVKQLSHLWIATWSCMPRNYYV